MRNSAIGWLYYLKDEAKRTLGRVASNHANQRRPTCAITKATPTTDKQSVEYNTIDIIAKYNSSRTRPRTNLIRDSKVALNPERPHFES